MNPEFLNNIKQLIQTFHEKMEEQMPALQQEVNELIVSKNKNPKQIEHSLDTLLSLATHGIAEPLFIKLLEYYKHIDSEGAAFYWEQFEQA